MSFLEGGPLVFVGYMMRNERKEMKTKRYVLPALPERQVVLVPLVGGKTLLSQVMSVLRNERIPRNAKVRILTNRITGTRSLRYEWSE